MPKTLCPFRAKERATWRPRKPLAPVITTLASSISRDLDKREFIEDGCLLNFCQESESAIGGAGLAKLSPNKSFCWLEFEETRRSQIALYKECIIAGRVTTD